MNLIPRNFFWDEIFDSLPSKGNNPLKCDIYTEGNNYIVIMDIPGFKKEEVKIEVDNGYLNISISKNTENNDETRNYIRRERTFQEYKRSFYMGDVNESEIKANFTDGVLKITIPKKEQVETKKIVEIE